MKTNFLNICFLFAIVFSFMGCSNDFLENQPYGEKIQETFYQNPDEAFEGLVAVYDVLQRQEYGGSFLTSEIASDNCFGGFGTADDNVSLEWDRFQLSSDLEMYNPVWENNYLGIYRANVLLANMENVDWGDDEDKSAHYEAEARFLRAFFHFRLARFFGEIVPLDHVMETDEFETPRAPAEETYSLIAEDLKFAIENLPTENYSGSKDFGRINKWAAESMMARVFLFYSGYYGESNLANVVSKEDVVGYINDVIENSGYDLIDDFSRLWPAASMSDYVGEDNNEIIWSVRFNSSGKGDWDLHEGNRFQVLLASRGGDIGNYAQGWGAATVNPKLFDSFERGDSRRTASIIDYVGEGLDYDPVATGQRQYTGYMIKKYAPITNEEGEGAVAAEGGDFQIDNYIDQVIIRFADVLLMGAELNLDSNKAYSQELLNRVRERAFGDSNHSVAATRENIMEERKLELAFEGLRYFDLIRQGMEVTKRAIDNKDNTGEFNVEFRPETMGLFPIPQSQINISNGSIGQNPGW